MFCERKNGKLGCKKRGFIEEEKTREEGRNINFYFDINNKKRIIVKIGWGIFLVGKRGKKFS